VDFLTAKLGKRRVGPDRELLVQLIDSSLTHILDTERFSTGRGERCDLLLDLRLAATEIVDLEAAVANGTPGSSAAVTTEVNRCGGPMQPLPKFEGAYARTGNPVDASASH